VNSPSVVTTDKDDNKRGEPVMSKRSMRYLALASGSTAALLASLAMAPAAYAQEQITSFNIPEQPLATALLDLGRQAHISVAAPHEVVAGKTARSVQGDLSTRQALIALLDGSGLSYDFVGPTAVRITAPQSGSAAGDGADSGTVQALVVTAQKREENIQDVPIAMSAFSQEDLTKSQVAGGPDLMTQIPNFTFTKTNFSSFSIQIRGIGTQAISATTDAAVAVAFNNTPFIRNRFFEQEFYDLERVEVLRGPQGTLYGRNATAGVVNIISAKPSFRYQARLSADVANYNSTRLEGMLNIPLVDDKVALRLAGAWTKRHGYVTNGITGNPIDGRDLWSTRVSLRIAPTDRVNANLIWEHFQENDDRLRSGKQLCMRHTPTEIGGIPMPVEGEPGYAGSAMATFSQGCIPTSLYSPDAFQTPNGFSLPYYSALGQVGGPVVDGVDPYLNVTQSRDLRVIDSSFDPKYYAKSDLGELQVSFELTDGITLVSETGYNADHL
jgi:outer membrane receptor protein involved in Fe transport